MKEFIKRKEPPIH